MDALEDLQVWQRACRFSVSTFKLLADCREYAFRDQLGPVVAFCTLRMSPKATSEGLQGNELSF